MPTPAPAQLRAHLHRVVRRFGALASGTTPCGQPLSMAYAHALMILAEHGPLTHQALGAILCVDKSTVARLGARLVAQGHARQAAPPGDRRSRVVELTAAGRRVAGTVERASHQRFAALLAAVPARRRADVVDALALLARAVEALPLHAQPPSR
ncbi:MAG: MarR family transcriptional regulator [Myxococcales bacterium]|nr:MarR family transcriptional regulator [Myxococcales bacterium]